MIENQLKNIAYLFYPKDICNINEKEKYIFSDEFKRLSFVLNSFYLINSNLIPKDKLMSCFQLNSLTKEIQDKSILNIDRCLTFEIEIIENDNKLVKICLYVSLIVPYYSVYVLENEISLTPYKWLTIPKRNKILEKNKYDAYIQIISSIVEEVTMFNKFPEQLGKIILPEISYQDITKGNFTLFNAFFNDEDKFYNL